MLHRRRLLKGVLGSLATLSFWGKGASPKLASDLIPAPTLIWSMPESLGPNLFVALHQGYRDLDGRIIVIGECTYPGYERVAVARDGTQWAVANGRAENAKAITFPYATGSCQDVVAASIHNAQGDRLFMTDLMMPRTITAGVCAEFQPGCIVIGYECDVFDSACKAGYGADDDDDDDDEYEEVEDYDDWWDEA